MGDTRSDFSPDDTSHRVTVRLYFKGSSPEERRKADEKRKQKESKAKVRARVVRRIDPQNPKNS